MVYIIYHSHPAQFTMSIWQFFCSLNVNLYLNMILLNRALTRPYISQLKLAEYFPNWVFPKFLNPTKLKNKYYWFFVHTRGYKLQFDYDIYWLQYCIKIIKTILIL